MKKIIGFVICGMLVLNLSSVMTLGLKAVDKIGTSMGLCTIEVVEKGSELIYAVEDLGL